MKAACYSVICVFLVVLGLITTFSFARVTGRAEKKAVENKREVYVDIDRLVALHPASAAVLAMEEIVADGMKMPSATGYITAMPKTTEAVNIPEFISPVDSKLEQRLDAELTQKTKTELERLEMERLQAMSARLRQNRESRFEDASSELNAGIKEIRKEENEQLQALAKEYSLSRINARVKVSALKAAQDSGVNKAGLKLSLDDYESDLNRTESAYAADEKKIKDIYQGKVDTLQKSVSNEIDCSLAEYELNEKMRIGTSIASARKEIIAGISKTTIIADMHKVAGKDISGDCRDSSGIAAKVLGVDGAEVSKTLKPIDDMNARVRADVIRMVKSIAAEKNVKVSFIKGRGTDATESFGSVIRERGWMVSAPVMSSWNGS